MANQTRTPAEAALSRLGAISRLPVFYALKGRRVLLAGGGHGATWKAEMLAAAGAHVVVVAEDASPEMAALLVRGAAAGTFEYHARRWQKEDLRGCTLAVGDCETGDEAAAFAAAAHAAGVPVNTIDKPETCDFQFGSIVNRSPVVIGISTDGVAPILGQAIRQRIETLLPAVLSDWAGLARRVRASVMQRLSAGAPRRAFWEAFALRALKGERVPDDSEAGAMVAAAAQAAPPAGRVTLVGAGPGDVEFLTIKAMRALQAADVVMADDLVSPEVLDLARREARRIMVGKRGQRASCKQDDINALLVEEALKGRHVVRLKAGDPAVFGRAGEEIAALTAAGVPVTIVPGITSAQALAAALCLSLTHRDHAQSLTLMTGHSRQGVLPETLDFHRAAGTAATNIVYMGARTAGPFSAAMIAGGADPALPAVAVSSLSRPDQQIWRGPLSALAEGVASLPPGAPVLIGTGHVFGLPQGG